MKILVVGLHVDDCECGVGGTIALLTQKGHEVVILNIQHYNHHKGGDEKVDKQSIEAAQILGARKIILDYNETKYYKSTERSVRDIQEIIKQEKPDIMFIMHPKDNHLSHVECAKATREAIFGAAVEGVCPNEIYTYATGAWQSGCYLIPDFTINIEAVYDKFKECITHFGAERANGERLFRAKDIRARYIGNANFVDVAEGFKIFKYPKDNNDFILRNLLNDEFRWSGTNMYYPQSGLFL